MNRVSFHPPSLLAGAGLAALAFVTLGQKAAPAAHAAPAAPPAGGWEYKIVDDPEAKELGKLAEEGWEYAGYLGTGVKGSGNDETLWRKPTK